jgi:hypothetical protein
MRVDFSSGVEWFPSDACCELRADHRRLFSHADPKAGNIQANFEGTGKGEIPKTILPKTDDFPIDMATEILVVWFRSTDSSNP